MNWLFEQPLAVVIVGVVLSLGVGMVWTSTGRKEWLFALGAVVLLTIAGLIVEQLVVITDREAIEATLARNCPRCERTTCGPSLSRHISSKPPRALRCRSRNAQLSLRRMPRRQGISDRYRRIVGTALRPGRV
jgi:hypothetical protein